MGDEMSDDEAEEELLLVNSFVNGRNTITALPGPFRDALNAPKSFKLRFNDEPQEEDIHMFPTEPSHPDFLPPAGGILKGVKRTGSSSTSSMAKKKHDTLSGSDEGRGQVRFVSKGPATSPTSKGAGGAPPKASFRPGDHHYQPPPPTQNHPAAHPQQHYTYAGASVGFMDDVDERDLYDFVGMGHGSSRGPSSSSSNSSGVAGGARVPPPAQGGSAPTSPPRTAEDRLRSFMREMHLQQQQQLAALADEKGSVLPHRTASAGGSKGSPAAAAKGGSPRQPYKQQRPVSFAVGEDADAKRYDRKSVDFEDAVMTPSLSLYDLAAMPLELSVDKEYKSTTIHRGGTPSSAQRNGRHKADTEVDDPYHHHATSKPTKTTRYADDKGGGTYLLEQERIVLSRSQPPPLPSYTRNSDREDDQQFDPLAAFQHGAAVRVRHDVTRELAALGVGTGGVTRTSRGGNVRNAWADDDVVDARPRGKSPQIRQQPPQPQHAKAAPSDYSAGPAVARTYRHGSPAQVRSVRPGTAPARGSATSSRPKAVAPAVPAQGSKPRAVGQSPARGNSQAHLLQPPPPQRRGSFDSLSFDNVSAFDSVGSGRASRPASPGTKPRGYPAGTSRAHQHPNQFVGAAPRSSTPTSSRGWR